MTATVEKNIHDLTALSGFLAERTAAKSLTLKWKKMLFLSEDKKPPRTEYIRLMKAAERREHQ